MRKLWRNVSGRSKRVPDPEREEVAFIGQKSRELEAKEREIEYAERPAHAHGTIQYPNDQQIIEALRIPYQYQKLDERRGDIRLVNVEFSNRLGGGHIVCNMEAHAMSKLVGNHKYEAVSYVWGSSARSEKVLSSHSTSHLKITKSLLAILQRLARWPDGIYDHDRESYWIDGVCINQEDLEERSNQVQKMTNIYRRADCVHVFLGTFESDRAILLTSKWFTRRWVIQEAVAAQKVVLHFRRGGTWQQLNGWDALMSEADPDSPISLGSIDTNLLLAANFLHDIAETAKTRWSSVFVLMLKFHTAECREDSDRLFALLGVSHDVELQEKPAWNAPAYLKQFHHLKIWFKPDYTLNTGQLYRKFALAATRSPLVFDLLHCAGAFREAYKSSPKDLPSWVPDWRSPLLYQPLMGALECQAGLSKKAGKQAVSKKQTIAVNESDWSARIKGVLLGTVAQHCPLGIQSYLQQTQPIRVEWMSDDESTIDLVRGRSLIELQDEIRALVPKDVHPRDKIMIFLGARTPFVLRRQAEKLDGSIHYGLIGDCYVYDYRVMSGELLRETDASTVTEFRII